MVSGASIVGALISAKLARDERVRVLPQGEQPHSNEIAINLRGIGGGRTPGFVGFGPLTVRDTATAEALVADLNASAGRNYGMTFSFEGLAMPKADRKAAKRVG